MFSKSLIQFSVDGWGCVPSLLFTWGQTIVEVMKIMVTSFKRSHADTAAFSAPSPAAGHQDGGVMVESSDKTWSIGKGMNHFSIFALRTPCTE